MPPFGWGRRALLRYPPPSPGSPNRRSVPFADTRIPVLGPVELAAFTAIFDRTRDWADIEAMVGAGTLDTEAVESTLLSMLEADDARLTRLGEAVSRASAAGSG